MAEGTSANFSERFDTEITSTFINSSMLSFFKETEVGGETLLSCANKQCELKIRLTQTNKLRIQICFRLYIGNGGIPKCSTYLYALFSNIIPYSMNRLT